MPNKSSENFFRERGAWVLRVALGIPVKPVKNVYERFNFFACALVSFFMGAKQRRHRSSSNCFCKFVPFVHFVSPFTTSHNKSFKSPFGLGLATPSP